MADINGIPYVESSDLVSAYPAVSQSLAQEVSDQLASKLPYSYGTATPSTTDSGFLWYDSNTTPPVPKYWNGSSFATLAPAPGLEFITTVTIGTTVSSVTLSGVFSSTYDAYKIIISGGAASASNAQMTMQLGAANTNYLSAGVFGNSSASGGLGATTATSSWTVAEINTNIILANIEVINPNLAKQTYFSSAAYNQANTNCRFYSGYQASTTQFTDFTLAANAGTLTGGDIRVYGFKN